MTRKPLKGRHRDDATVTYTHAAFRPYALALGQLALAWNGLHETLGVLFCSVMGGGIANQFLAVWHALKADRAQRDILLAAARTNIRGPQPVKFIKDIEWVCKQADALEDKRNDALHSPLWGYKRGAHTTILPMAGFGHVRATKLFEKKDLIKEFRWCRDSAIILRDFAEAIDWALADYNRLWPERPSLPNRGDSHRHVVG